MDADVCGDKDGIQLSILASGRSRPIETRWRVGSSLISSATTAQETLPPADADSQLDGTLSRCLDRRVRPAS